MINGRELTSEQINKITKSTYYHLKHYDDVKPRKLEDFNHYFVRAEETALDAFNDIVEHQEKLERASLVKLFNRKWQLSDSALVALGFNQSIIDGIKRKYQIALSGDIQEKLDFLNYLSEVKIYSNKTDGLDGLEQAQRAIAACFSDAGYGNEFSNPTSLQMFLSSLLAIWDSLNKRYKEAKNNDVIVADLINAPMRKLKRLIDYYKPKYDKMVREAKMTAEELDAFFSNNDFIATPLGRDWSKKLDALNNLDVVKSVLFDSASGFLKQQEGTSYETQSLNYVKSTVMTMFDTFDYGKNVNFKDSDRVGTNKERLTNTYQKADILLNIQLTGEIEQAPFSITFSVKKSSTSATDIQVHHGGSLYAYVDRFDIMGFKEFDFLTDVRTEFPYYLVNNFNKSADNEAIIAKLKELFATSGYLFLGEEVKNISGATFLYVNEKIYSFSVLLKKMMDDDIRKYFSTVIRYREKPLYTEKKQVISSVDVGGFYTDKFIASSSEVGRHKLTSISYTIKLRKSALSL